MKIKAKESVEFALLIKSFYALAFLPPEHIEIAKFVTIISSKMSKTGHTEQWNR